MLIKLYINKTQSDEDAKEEIKGKRKTKRECESEKREMQEKPSRLNIGHVGFVCRVLQQ